MTHDDPSRSAPAKKPSRNRDLLIGAARSLMVADGYAATSTEAIVRKAGLTRGALYYQFVDKADLFRAVLDAEVARVAEQLAVQTMERAERGEDELRIGALLIIDLFAEPETGRILLVDGPAVLGLEPWKQALEPVFYALLQHGLEHIVEVGRLDEKEVEPLTHLLFGSLTQAAVAIGGASDPDIARGNYKEAASRLLSGIGAPA